MSVKAWAFLHVADVKKGKHAIALLKKPSPPPPSNLRAAPFNGNKPDLEVHFSVVN